MLMHPAALLLPGWSTCPAETALNMEEASEVLEQANTRMVRDWQQAGVQQCINNANTWANSVCLSASLPWHCAGSAEGIVL